MHVIGLLCASLDSSTVLLHYSLGSRSTCACSKVGFSSQNGNRTWGIYYRKLAVFLCFFWAKWLNAKIFMKKRFLFTVRSVCRVKRFITGSINSQGRSKVSDDARPGGPIKIATEATVQRVEVLIRADRRIRIDSVATALGCSHGLA
jgi:hypothetical protein